MPILSGDIKLVASQVMDDVPEGGGAPTANVIADGVSNAIFPDISELDRAGGRVNLRKVHVSVQTTDTATYLGSNIIVAEPPSDPNVSVTLFTTADTFDRRDAAKSRIESYLTQGPEWAGFLYENHIIGQRAIQLFQRPTSEVPPIGRTLVLILNEGLGNELKQYVRITRTSFVVSLFYDAIAGKDFEAMVVTAEISDALRYDFAGSPASRSFSRATGARIRDTLVADAGIYAGVVPLVSPVSLGALTATGAGVYTQLVPSAQTEIPLVDYDAAGQSTTVTASATGQVSYSTAQTLSSTTAFSLGMALVPGTLSIAIGAVTLTDSGGQVFEGSAAVGLVDYARGVVTFATLTASYSGTKTVSFTPATAPLRVANTAQRPVTQETRAYNYIGSLLPTPSPGSVLVSYRANDRWYDLRDNGSGVLKGLDSSFGAGTVNYATGSVLITTGALPDVGSSVMFAWNSPVNYLNRSALAVPAARVKLQVANPAIQPASVVITWNDGAARTAIDNGKGVISGDATGVVYYETGLIELVPTLLPAGNQQYSVAYAQADVAAAKGDAFPDPTRNGDTTMTLQLATGGVTPGTVSVGWPIALSPPNVTYGSGGGANSGCRTPTASYAKDDGDGNLKDALGRIAGSINYATGAINLQPDGPVMAAYYENAYEAWSSYMTAG